MSYGKSSINTARLGMALICVAALAIHAQSQETAVPHQAFEVASIKPTDPSFTLRSMQIPLTDGRINIRGLTLKELIQFAWGNAPVGTGLHPDFVSGGPAWVTHDRYDIVAQGVEGSLPSREARKLMLRSLLVERFELRLHPERRAATVYALKVMKNGPRMKERISGDGGSPFGLPMLGLHIPGRNASMAQLADMLQTLIPLTDPERDDLPVIDLTGLPGRYDFDLTWAGDPALLRGRGGLPPETNAPDLFTAVQEQLGLRLETQRRSVGILVIDNAVRPSAN